MYRSILLILYALVLIPSLTHLIRYRDIPSSRRWAAGLGIAGLLLAPTIAYFLYELIVTVLSFGLLLLIFFGGIGMLFRFLFR